MTNELKRAFLRVDSSEEQMFQDWERFNIFDSKNTEELMDIFVFDNRIGGCPETHVIMVMGEEIWRIRANLTERLKIQ